jgi:hypothetical protein
VVARRTIALAAAVSLKDVGTERANWFQFLPAIHLKFTFYDLVSN